MTVRASGLLARFALESGRLTASAVKPKLFEPNRELKLSVFHPEFAISATTLLRDTPRSSASTVGVNSTRQRCAMPAFASTATTIRRGMPTSSIGPRSRRRGSSVNSFWPRAHVR